MTEQIKELLKQKDIVMPKLLFSNYKKIDLTAEELIFITYLINGSEIFNPKQISNDMNMTLNEVMTHMENLSSKGILRLEVKKVGNTRNEYIDLDGLYSKLTFNILNKEKEEKKTTIYDICEQEFGRPISPMEYQIIGAWLDNGTSEEIIKLAIKEAVYNGTTHLRYIDSIINNWTKKGIKNAHDVEQSKKNFKQKKEKKINNEILEYDWLNDE